MEFIEPIWAFAVEWKVRLLVLAVLGQMVLAIRLYALMAKMRFRAAKEGRVTADTFRATQNEPEDLAVYSRVVVNQFEAPVLFYAIVAIGLALAVSSWITVILAVAFVVLRWMHASEMTGEHDVMRRRKIFLWSFQVLIAMMVELAISTLIWA